MRIEHLTDDELDLVLAGETSPADVEQHLAGCLACRRRHESFVAALRGAAGEDPGDAERERVRASVVARWAGRRPVSRWWWLAAAAAVLLALLIPFHHSPQPEAPAINPDAVLRDVDAVLAQDPLASFAPEDVVRTVLPTPETNQGRSST